MGDGARRVGVDQLGRLRDGHAVAAADEGIALDHGGQRRVHAPRPEGDDLALARRALAPGGLGRDAGGLAEEPEERRLVFRPLDVGALDDEHRLMRAEQRPLIHGPDVDREPLEQARRFLDPGEHPEAPVRLREALQPDLRLDALREAAGPEDLHGAGEVDVRHLSRFDVGLGGDVEASLGLIRHTRYGPPGPVRVAGLSQNLAGMSIDRGRRMPIASQRPT